MFNEEKLSRVNAYGHLLRRSVSAALMRNAFCEAVFPGFTVSLLIVAILRFFHFQPPYLALASFFPVTFFFAVFAFKARKQIPSVEKCVAAIDATSNAGGLMMAANNHVAEEWQIVRTVMPTVLLLPAPTCRYSMFSIIGLITMLLLPSTLFERIVTTSNAGVDLLIESKQDRLKELIADDVITEEAADEFKEWLDDIAEKSDSSRPAELLDALDHIANEMERAVAEAAAVTVAEHDALLSVEAIADIIQNAIVSNVLEETKMPEVWDALRDLISNSELLPQTKSNLIAQISTDGLSHETLETLLEEIKSASMVNSNRLINISAAELKELSLCEGGICTNTASALAMAVTADGCGGEAARRLCELTGSETVSRGRGEAALTWKEASSSDGTASVDITLKPDSVIRPDDTTLKGVTFSAPNVDDKTAPIKPGALQGEGGSDGATRKSIVLPRHRAAVKKYFGGDK